MTPRHFGHAFGFEGERVSHVTVEDVSEDRWAIGAMVAFVLLLGGIGLYAFGSADIPMLASAPADETSGQGGSRPTLPAVPY